MIELVKKEGKDDKDAMRLIRKMTRAFSRKLSVNQMAIEQQKSAKSIFDGPISPGRPKPMLVRRNAGNYEEEKLNALQHLLEDPSLGPNL